MTMHRALRPYTAAVLAAAGAGVVAISVAASAAADPADVAAQIASTGESEISYGSALFDQGDLSDGLNYLVNGENNALIAAPVDALLAQIESPDQTFYYSFYDPTAQLPFPTDFAQLSSDLQVFVESGQNALSEATTEFAQGATNLGDELLVQGFSDLSVGLTEESLIGPLYIAFANFG
jgi:hypothetical protein